MIVKPIRDDIRKAVQTYQVEKQFDKQIRFIEQVGTSYPSLRFKPLTETKKLDPRAIVYEFRITDKYRAYCIKPEPEVIEVIAVDAHERIDK